MKERIGSFLIIIIVMIGIYFIATGLRNDELGNIQFIKKDFKITKGIVISKSVYKGRTIRVKYNVQGKYYTNSDGININDHIEKGDSVTIKYSVTKPELMITEFNNEF